MPFEISHEGNAVYCIES